MNGPLVWLKLHYFVFWKVWLTDLDCQACIHTCQNTTDFSVVRLLWTTPSIIQLHIVSCIFGQKDEDCSLTTQKTAIACLTVHVRVLLFIVYWPTGLHNFDLNKNYQLNILVGPVYFPKKSKAVIQVMFVLPKSVGSFSMLLKTSSLKYLTWVITDNPDRIRLLPLCDQNKSLTTQAQTRLSPHASQTLWQTDTQIGTYWQDKNDGLKRQTKWCKHHITN